MMKILIGLALIISIASCTKSVFYKSDTAINQSGWDYKNKLEYSFNIENTNQNYDFILNLKHQPLYAYSNIYFFIDIIDPNNKTYRDTIECFMASYTGKWYGEQQSGEIKQQFMYRPNANFPTKGRYRVYIEQAMRDTVLKNISKFGIELRETKTKSQ